jgi:hypothetical protein
MFASFFRVPNHRQNFSSPQNTPPNKFPNHAEIPMKIKADNGLTSFWVDDSFRNADGSPARGA